LNSLNAADPPHFATVRCDDGDGSRRRWSGRGGRRAAASRECEYFSAAGSAPVTPAPDGQDSTIV
jgi:hypothetical protein